MTSWVKKSYLCFGTVGILALLAWADRADAVDPVVSIEISEKNGTDAGPSPVSSIEAAPGDIITVELFVRDWSPQGQLLRGYQTQLNSSGYTSGVSGNVFPKDWATTTDLNGKCSAAGPDGVPNDANVFIDVDDCFANAPSPPGEPDPVGSDIGPWGIFSPCTWFTDCLPGTGICEAPSIDWVFGQVTTGTQSTTNSIMCDHRHIGAADEPLDGPLSLQDGTKYYLGTVVLEVSSDAGGTFTLCFDETVSAAPPPLRDSKGAGGSLDGNRGVFTFLADENNDPIEPLAYECATITIPVVNPTVSIEAVENNGTDVGPSPANNINAQPGDILTVELFVRDWSPQGQHLRGYQTQLDSTGYTSGSAGDIFPRDWAITTDLNGKCSAAGPDGVPNPDNVFIDVDDCFANAPSPPGEPDPVGSDIGPWGIFSPCTWFADCLPGSGICEAPSIDWVFGQVTTGTQDQTNSVMCDHRHIGAADVGLDGPIANQDGTKYYLGTVVLEVSSDADGTFTLCFDQTSSAPMPLTQGTAAPERFASESPFSGINTFLADENNDPIEPLDYECLTVTIGGCPTCLGDVNGDGDINGLDIQCFTDCVLGSPGTCECDCADINGDGEVTTDDTALFVQLLLYFTGPCSELLVMDCNQNGEIDYLEYDHDCSIPPNGVPDECEGSMDGDFDCDIDLDDYVLFYDCLSGPGTPYPPGIGCPIVDCDGDGDVDLQDFACFQVLFGTVPDYCPGEPGYPAPPCQ